eukprot:c21494_g1_i1 orf=260-1960(+)
MPHFLCSEMLQENYAPHDKTSEVVASLPPATELRLTTQFEAEQTNSTRWEQQHSSPTSIPSHPVSLPISSLQTLGHEQEATCHVQDATCQDEVVSANEVHHTPLHFLYKCATQARIMSPAEPNTSQSQHAAHLSFQISTDNQQLQSAIGQPYVPSVLNASEHVYPAALATHEQVLADEHLFQETLQKLHVALAVKCTIPKIGRKDLNLHILYREVTSRGGLEVVIKDRKWKAITIALDFPPTITNASYILRKYYTNLLHHYEQVYFRRAQGQIVPPPATMTMSSPVVSQLVDSDFNHEASDCVESGMNTTKGAINSAQALGVDPASSIGSVVTGSIDGKFDHGYLVTVMVGMRKMRGVLYHVPSTNSLPQNAIVPALVNNIGSELKSSDLGPMLGEKRRRKDIMRKDPKAPRQNRTGYNFFFAEQHAKLKMVKPDKDRMISKIIGDLWNKLSEDERSPYQELGIQDKERYRREMKQYREGNNLQLTWSRNSIDLQGCYRPSRKSKIGNGNTDPCCGKSNLAIDTNDLKLAQPQDHGLDAAGGSVSLEPGFDVHRESHSMWEQGVCG